ncbi:MAG: tetratricopeptide repeat protein [Hydrogenimonas sp.]|nr:tetratricopeptide repeat protein [Hydrogenimonas sp.]
MAEEEVIILDEEEERASLEKENQEEKGQNRPKDSGNRKRLYILLGALALATATVIVLLVIFLSKEESTKESIDTSKLAQKIKTAQKIKPLAAQSELEKMIKKANILYAKGDKKEALKLFEQIATYSAAISNYNLGVAQMKQGLYEEAIASFKKAIESGENRTISALNAAVCALHLKDEKRFDYYLQLAEVYLPESFNSPLYSYLYAAVNFYRGNYFEILSAVNHPVSSAYKKELDRIGAISYTTFDRPIKAVELLERSTTPRDYLFLGQLYARTGEYELATQYLKKAIDEALYPYKSRKALALVDIKNQRPQSAAKLLKELKRDFKGKGLDLYPIKTSLHPSVYDIDAAQKRFSAESLTAPPTAYRLIFEFAPFKVFNANQTINYIKKGNASIYVDEESEASKYLSRSSKISGVNLLISKAIKAAIENRLQKANSLLLEALKSYPNHSILHYNLALTYAQMGNFTKANRHFLRSYHLDSSNYLSAIFALMCETFTGKEVPQVEKFIQEDLKQIDNPDTKQKFYQSLLYFYQGNSAGASKWLQTPHDNRPIYLLFDTIIAANMGMWEEAKSKVKKLRDVMPKDVLANLIYLEITYKDLGIKSFSAKAARYLKKRRLNLDAVYYGSAFTRENYIALRFITGTLYRFKVNSKERLLEEQEDPAGIVEALALSNIYLREFEEAYVLFNQLVDKYKHQDSRTLFLAAVASIGADHPANASALLELAKLSDPNNLESRYALALLYMEQGNYDAAVIQLSKIPNGTFKSNYFDFKIRGEGHL